MRDTINRSPAQYTTSFDVKGYVEINIQLVHSVWDSVDATPLLFIHGWSGSFAEVTKALPGLNSAGFNVVPPLPSWFWNAKN